MFKFKHEDYVVVKKLENYVSPIGVSEFRFLIRCKHCGKELKPTKSGLRKIGRCSACARRVELMDNVGKTFGTSKIIWINKDNTMIVKCNTCGFKKLVKTVTGLKHLKRCSSCIKIAKDTNQTEAKERIRKLNESKHLVGKKFGTLTVLSKAEPLIIPSGKKFARWLVRCDCGVEKEMITIRLKESKACGKMSAHPDIYGIRTNTVVECKASMDNKSNQRVISSGNSSGFTGVYWDKARLRWRPSIIVSGVRHRLGRFKDISDAVRARNNYIIENGLEGAYKIQTV